MNSIVVSVIIPVYNDWHRLSFCLNALSGQTFSTDKFEVIVVNNNPDDTTPSNFKLDDNCKIITENKPGSYAARNAGLEIANGKIIGFTDSDCIPDKNWIKNAVEHFADNSSCCRIGGKIEIFFNSSNPGIAELYDKLFSFNQKRYVESAGTSVTANLFTYKFLFDKIGYFNSNLMSGGDYSWGTLAQKNGYKIDYAENVIVNHPARETLKDLIKKEKRVGGSQAIFLKKNTSTLNNITTFVKELRPRIGTIKSIFRSGKELTFKHKLYITLFRHYLLVTRAYSKLRVEMGRKANRA